VSAPALELRGLAHRYPDGTEALRGIDLAIAPGESVGLVGPNGAGKSTLALNVVGFLHPTSGSVRVFGTEVGHPTLTEVRRRVGLVFQNPTTSSSWRLFDDVAFGPPTSDCRDEVRRRVAAALAGVGWPASKVSGISPEAEALGGARGVYGPSVAARRASSNLDSAGAARIRQLPRCRRLPVATHDLSWCWTAGAWAGCRPAWPTARRWSTWTRR
jgi:ABC-type ATPase involved in cell division